MHDAPSSHAVVRSPLPPSRSGSFGSDGCKATSGLQSTHTEGAVYMLTHNRHAFYLYDDAIESAFILEICRDGRIFADMKSIKGRVLVIEKTTWTNCWRSELKEYWLPKCASEEITESWHVCRESGNTIRSSSSYRSAAR